MKVSANLIAAILACGLMTGCGAGAAYDQAHIATLMRGADRSNEADSYSAFLVARYASLTNDPRRALEGYEAAFSSAPEEVDLAERAVFAALMAGEFEHAVRVARRVEQPAMETSTLVRLTLAVDAIHDGQAARAERLLNSGRYGPFNHAMATNLQAWLTLERAGPEAAKEQLLTQIGQDPLLDSVSLYMLGMIHLSAGEDAEALTVFETLWDKGPRLAQAAEAQARLLALRGRKLEAITLLSTFRREIGPNPSIDRLKAELVTGAPIVLPRPTLKEGAALAIYAPAAALSAQTSSDFSGVYFAMALALDPQMDVARTLWADALDQAGRRGDAISVLSQVDPASEFYATARGQMAWALRREGYSDDALEVANEALAATRDRDLMVQIGDLLTTLDRDGEAEQVFTDVIAMDTAQGAPDWRLWLARGAARERLGRWPEAEVDLRQALALSPDNAEILNHLGYNLIDRGLQLEEGMRLISRAADLEPRSGLILDSLGWAYFMLGDHARAVVHLERAVELAPGDPVINEHLGDAYWRIGRRLEARFQWRRALTLNPRPSDVTGLHAKLETGLPSTGTSLVSVIDLPGQEPSRVTSDAPGGGR
ncbi:MAG: tetratricopeptide repeat protein [Hyphomonadaceae bacterium]|nr:tetratricopeptide repeat protein [Hyphomonadaceae bacterium]